MGETFGRPDDIPVWHAAVNGTSPDWDAFLADYVATVDWPACAFWRELADANPDAVVLLSTRSSADAWWKSANDTIFQISTREHPGRRTAGSSARRSRWRRTCSRRRSARLGGRDRGQARVRGAQRRGARRPSTPARLVEWQPGDGWEPLCAALDVAVPDDPFPHVNTTADFRAMTGMD